MQPRLKPTVQFHYLSQNLYFVSAGSATKLDQNAEFLRDLCLAMDGKNTVAQLKTKMAEKYPNESQYTEDALSFLDSLYLLEDTESNKPDNLNDYDLIRWSRNVEFFGANCRATENKYQHQERLKNIKVVLLGLGGLGSHLLFDLAALGVTHIRAIDFDKVELSNLNRQILYTEEDLGCLKTEIAEKRISQFLPQHHFEFINMRINSQAQIESLIEGSEIVICVADKPKLQMQQWLNAACTKYKIPFINGGIDNKRAIYCTVIPDKTGCIECWKNSVQHSNAIAHQILENECAEAFPTIPWPAMVHFVSVLTGTMLTEFIKIATGISIPRSAGRLMAFDFDKTELREVETWEKSPHCSVCSQIGGN